MTRQFKKAIELLLSYTSPFDSAIFSEIRKKSGDPSNYSQIIGKLPKGMDIEHNIMSALLEGKDPISALEPSQLLYVGYLFKHTKPISSIGV